MAVNAVNMEAAQLVVGAAILDARYRRLLLNDPVRALRSIERQSTRLARVRLTSQDRLALVAIRARTLAEFGRGVERLRAQAAAQPQSVVTPAREMAG